MMNDPQVQALIYRIEHDESVDYGGASPVSRDERGFRVSAPDLRVRFDFSEHYATEEEAQEAIAEYIRAWEFVAQLEHGPNGFSLQFEKAVIVDRNPRPIQHDDNTVPVSASFRGGRATGGAHLTVTSKPDSYPSPPAGLAPSPDAESMHHRYMGYRLKREYLPGMAYFCLTMLTKRMSREAAATRYHVDKDVLDEIGRLSSTSGGAEARKGEGISRPLDSVERRFLEAAIKRLILRVAERTATPAGDLAQIKLSDLPRLPERPS